MKKIQANIFASVFLILKLVSYFSGRIKYKCLKIMRRKNLFSQTEPSNWDFDVLDGKELDDLYETHNVVRIVIYWGLRWLDWACS